MPLPVASSEVQHGTLLQYCNEKIFVTVPIFHHSMADAVQQRKRKRRRSASAAASTSLPFAGGKKPYARGGEMELASTFYLASAIQNVFLPYKMLPEAIVAWNDYAALAFVGALAFSKRVGGTIKTLPGVWKQMRSWGLLNDTTDATLSFAFRTDREIGGGLAAVADAWCLGYAVFSLSVSGSIAKAWTRMRVAACAVDNTAALFLDGRETALGTRTKHVPATGINLGYRLLDGFAGSGSVSASIDTLRVDGVSVVAAFDNNRNCSSLYNCCLKPRSGVLQSTISVGDIPSHTLSLMSRRSNIIHWFSTPCQSFSKDGSRRGWDDVEARNALRDAARCAKGCPGLAVIVENVEELATKHPKALKAYKLAFADAGYPYWVIYVRDSQFTGAPHHRERLHMIFFAKLSAAINFRAPKEVLPRVQQVDSIATKLVAPFNDACAQVKKINGDWGVGGYYGEGVGSGFEAVAQANVQIVKDILQPAALVRSDCWVASDSRVATIANKKAADGLIGITELKEGELVSSNFWRIRTDGGGTFYAGRKTYGAREDVSSSIQTSSLYLRARGVDGVSRIRTHTVPEILSVFRFPADRVVPEAVIKKLGGTRQVCSILGNGTVIDCSASTITAVVYALDADYA